jgi:hypothetical protein
MASVSNVTRCQSCDSPELEPILSLGMLPLVNDFRPASEPCAPQTFYPHDMLRCQRCELVQLGIDVDPELVFTAGYPYTSSTTRVLRVNFTDLYRDVAELLTLAPSDLVIDIGGNDGNLLSNFTAHRTLNVTPEDIGKLGEDRGIAHLQRYWGHEASAEAVAKCGQAKVITATNVFAHVRHPHAFLDAALSALAPGGLLVLECQYFGDLLDGVQYDHCYVEHRFFYSVTSLLHMMRPHGLALVALKTIPTHGGSFRAIFAREGDIGFSDWAHRAELHRPSPHSLAQEFKRTDPGAIHVFAKRVARSKRKLWALIDKLEGGIAGIGAPSRASTLISYTGLDHEVVPYICETTGSHKIGKYMPGTKIPVVDEARLYQEQPANTLLLSHHIADELVANLRRKGFAGKFIKPLPEPEVLG